jgi:hypothetical protein
MWKIPFKSGAYKNGAGFFLPAAPKIRKPTTKVVGFFYFCTLNLHAKTVLPQMTLSQACRIFCP